MEASGSRSEGGGGFLIPYSFSFFYENQVSRFLFLLLSRISCPILANPASRERQIPNLVTFFSDGNPSKHRPIVLVESVLLVSFEIVSRFINYTQRLFLMFI